MLTAESYEEMEKIVGDLKEGKIIMEKLKQLGLDDELGAYYDAKIVHRKKWIILEVMARMMIEKKVLVMRKNLLLKQY